ncbi:MAG: GDYXXLXY domain-containing protein [Flavobacteriales bacterium]|nr:GDYXXLXY domain-containing protein [Flavobacteriales bacterium]MCC6939435.1 GDYXXLXY domain-containing protein [Flavobacteriales bacterium]
MKRSTLIFLAIALVQLGFLAWMIFDHQRVLHDGEVFKFRTAPIDPRDPFRGEYVILNFEASIGEWPDPHAVLDQVTDQGQYGRQRSFALIAVSDTSGYAVITGLVAVEPTSGAFLPVTHYGEKGSMVDRVELPFRRFYLEEGDGATTESMLTPQWENGERTEGLPAYALVRVYQGQAVIEDLIIGDRSIHEWLNEQ